MSDETKLHVMAVLRRESEPAGSFALVLRWLMGIGEALPRSDDRFRVRVTLAGSRQQIAGDGTVVDPAPEHWIEVRPRPYVMIDPPRRGHQVGFTAGGEAQYQAVALKPVVPVDPAHAAGGSLRDPNDLLSSFGVGIIHLLDETEPSREAWRLANLLAPALRNQVASLSASGRSLTSMTLVGGGEDPVDRSAKSLARYFLQAGVRPIDMPQILTTASARFRETALTVRLVGRAAMPSVFALAEGSLREHVEHAALVTATLNDPTLLEALDDVRRTRQQTRQQLRLRALQGGMLLDFWCSPDAPAAACDDAARGAQYPSAELFGTGLRIGGIAADQVREWVERNEVLTVKVQHDTSGHQPRLALGFVEGLVATPGNLEPAGLQVERFEDGDAPPLRPTEIRSAVDHGSSHPPPPPRDARINYDLTQSNAGHVDAGGQPVDPSATFETGEGKIQFLIQPPDFAKGEKTVYAFNLYGMWEEAATELFFRDPPPRATLAELRPWRISSRYSHTRDLAGAFPSAGAPHKALLAALDDPPWFPIQERPDNVVDPAPALDPAPGGPVAGRPETQPRDRPLPQVGRDAMTAASIDLRKGMASGAAAPAGVTVRWDPFGPLSLDWTPARRRDGSPAGARPQRYRFWVTSVDPFEQESEPVPVATNDAQAGEPASVIYSPRFRTPIGPPPQRYDGVRPALALTFDAAAAQLVVAWETPTAAAVATDGAPTAPAPKVDKAILTGQLVLFRRRLTKPVETAQPSLMAFATDLPDAPQWRAADASMRERGFEAHQTVDRIQPPTAGDAWSCRVPLAWADRGFEYVAGVCFHVRDEMAPFWAPNVNVRDVVTQVLRGDKFEAALQQIAELPRCSDVSLTDALPVVNDAEPRGPARLEPDFAPAAPVLPLPRMSRDLILLRLLAHAIKDVPERPWPDAGATTMLSAGRIAMCEAAIRRAVDPTGGEDRLRLARELLAREFGAAPPDAKPILEPSAPLRLARVLAQHATIGFRGLLTLRWRYTPFAAQAPENEREAEAVAFRVYQVRAPYGRKDALAYATFRGRATAEAGGAYRFTALDAGDAAAILSVAERQPAVARIAADADAEPAFRGVAGLDLADPARPLLRLADPPAGAPALPAAGEIMVFAAQPLTEVAAADYAQVSEHSLVVPVGGGTPEMFFWWVVAVSAQGREAGPGRRAVISRYAPMSIEPEPPLELTCGPPTDQLQHELDPANAAHRAFLPSRINNPDRAHNNPRLLVTWTEPQQGAVAATDALLVLWRQRQKVTAGNAGGQAGLAALAASPWQALKRIEAVGPNDALAADDVAALAGWLAGQPVTPDDATPIAEADLFIAADRRLSSAKGLLTLNVAGPNGVVARPGFIDYFYANGDAALSMEGSWLYAYKAARAIDLDPQGQFGLPPDPTARYLLSRPSESTPFRLPEVPPTVVMRGTPRFGDLPPTSSPVVQFAFQTTPLLEHLGLAAFDEPQQFREWFYRIIVRRKLKTGMAVKAGTNFEPMWLEIDRPQVLRYGETCTIIDRGLERDAPDRVLTPTYQLSVTQMAVIEDEHGNRLGERVVRQGAKDSAGVLEFDVKVQPMKMRPAAAGRPTLLAEVNVTVPIAVI